MIQRRSIHSIVVRRITDYNDVAALSELVLAIDLLVSTVYGRRASPDIDVPLPGAEVVGTLLAVIFVCSPPQ